MAGKNVEVSDSANDLSLGMDSTLMLGMTILRTPLSLALRITSLRSRSNSLSKMCVWVSIIMLIEKIRQTRGIVLAFVRIMIFDNQKLFGVVFDRNVLDRMNRIIRNQSDVS